MVLLIDNYDSFVYNLARYVNELGLTSMVKRNDAVTIADIMALQPSHLIISPGPFTPEQAGISLAVVRTFGQRGIPILGVCLGHQAIAYVFGGHIVPAQHPQHGEAASIVHDGTGLFCGMPQPLSAGRYHSLAVCRDTLPAALLVTATHAEDGEIMAIRHTCLPIYGVQFHPESILTTNGHRLLHNFLLSHPHAHP